MTECNSCGACCDPVTLPFDYSHLLEWARNMSDRDAHWVRTAIMPMTPIEAYQHEPWLRRADLVSSVQANGIVMDGDSVFFYRCRWFDRDARQCTQYDKRPDVCRVYPWPDGTPLDGVALPPTCSFRADLGQSVEIRHV